MIVCCGETLIDFLPRKGEDGASVFQPFAGGSLFNVAVALGRLGTHTGLLSGVSRDFFGDSLLNAVHASNVDTSLCVLSDRPTTLAFVSLTDGHAKYAFFDEGSAGRMLVEAELPELPAEVTALHTGSIYLMAEPCGATVEALVRREAPNRVISFDPNVRPSLINDRDAYLARLDRLAGMSDIVKFSDDDMAWMAPDSDFETFAARWIDKGAGLVIMTRGAGGATALSRTATASVPAVKVTVADTIGAGDTFSAALLSRLDSDGLLGKDAIRALTDSQLHTQLGYAAAAAAITASRPGADPPWKHEMEQTS
ncbi:MAG: carbohydrate kinase [Bauldia sp.]|uniref:carbohydrate kinase family protein n=1 Tax=Bauldia sp. TaxID=2575872 RepID=UPI001D80F184|nr:carbohydrate kinase [Bauldia sp.]MCB1497227.1 carbohydrate kinase [Bauldia sp.]